MLNVFKSSRALCPRFSGFFFLVFFFLSSILISSLGEEGAGLCTSRIFVCLFCACMFLSFFSSSWCRGLAAVCDCGIPWTFLFFFFFFFFFFCVCFACYHNDPKFSDRYIWANSADPDQTASSLIRVYTVCHSVCTVWTHYSMVEPHSSNFRVITTMFWDVRIFRKFTVLCLPGARLLHVLSY